MNKRRILIQLDGDRHASTFDRVVAIDAGVEELFSYGGVEPADVQGLVHGAIFTRGPQDLKSTAFFVGGSNVAVAEVLLDRVKNSYFGPFRCSVLLDANGANTTAAAAVLSVRRHVDLSDCRALVAGGTGPVGQRVALLLARQGAKVWVASRSMERAVHTCGQLANRFSEGMFEPLAMTDSTEFSTDLQFDAMVSAGAAGAQTLSVKQLQSQSDLKIVVDLNAVPPAGIEGVDATAKATICNGVLSYGAIGVGGTKMKIHKAAILRLFESNNLILDAEQVFDLGLELELEE